VPGKHGQKFVTLAYPLFFSQFEDQSVRELLDVITIFDAIVFEHIAEALDFLNDVQKFTPNLLVGEKGSLVDHLPL